MVHPSASAQARSNDGRAVRPDGPGSPRGPARGALVAFAALGLGALLAPACASEVPPSTSGGGGAGTGAAGGGGAEPCAPGTTRECYSGPEGTAGKGACVAGTQTCAEDGSGFGSCSGEVTPTAERCETAADDDCDGEVNEADAGCACEVGAALPCYSGPQGTEGIGACAGGTSTCVLGTSWSACEGEVVPAVEDCSVPVDEDCDGIACSAPIFGAMFGGTGNDRALGVAVDAAGSTYVVGKFSGIVDFGGGPLTSAGGDDVFVVKLDPQGAHVWSRSFGDAGDQYATAVAVDPNGRVIVAGHFTGTITFDPLTHTASGFDAFVAALDPGGVPQWSARLGGVGDDKAWALAAGPFGQVAVAGSFNGTHHCTAQLPPVCKISQGGEDIFVRMYAADGTQQWVRTFGSTGDQVANAAAFDGAGKLLLAGHFQETLDLGGGSPPLGAAANRSKAFVAKLDAAGTQVEWSQAFGDADNDQQALALAVSASDEVAVAGRFEGSIAFDAVLNAAGGTDAFVAKLDASGQPLWSRGFGNLASQAAQGVAFDAAGNVLLTGLFEGVLDFGGGPVVSGGAFDLFLAKLGPAGDHLWSKAHGNVASQAGTGVAVDPTSAQVVVAGFAAGSVDFGTGALTAAGGEDAIVARFQP